MNRRKFLGMLAAAPLVAKAAPILKVLDKPTDCFAPQYFAPLEFEEIDPVIAKVAEELAYRAGVTMDALLAQHINDMQVQFA